MKMLVVVGEGGGVGGGGAVLRVCSGGFEKSVRSRGRA